MRKFATHLCVPPTQLKFIESNNALKTDVTLEKLSIEKLLTALLAHTNNDLVGILRVSQLIFVMNNVAKR